MHLLDFKMSYPVLSEATSIKQTKQQYPQHTQVHRRSRTEIEDSSKQYVQFKILNKSTEKTPVPTLRIKLN